MRTRLIFVLQRIPYVAERSIFPIGKTLYVSKEWTFYLTCDEKMDVLKNRTCNGFTKKAKMMDMSFL